jgi:aryl-alcohol dehydrogenase-like predicted oxidoreductase
MEFRTLGRTGPKVSALGLGCMGMSDMYGPADEEESIATIHDSLEAGVTLFDTGDYYGMGHNELLLRKALSGHRREDYLLSVKFGALRGPDRAWLGYDGRPAAVRNFLAYSLQRLGTDYIDIYRLGRVDPNVPIEDTIGAVGDLIRAGWIRHAGLSEAGAATIRRAHAVHPIVDLQIEYSLFSRKIESAILPTCRELGIGITAYGVLSRGLLSGHWTNDRALDKTDARAIGPRFSPENIVKNLGLVETLRAIATTHGVTVAQLAIAWVLSRGTDIVPLVGARRPDRLAEALASLHVHLGDDVWRSVTDIVPAGAASGERYAPQAMIHLDSEK